MYFQTVSVTWRPTLEKLRDIDLSLYGRATVLNTFSLSKVYYIAQVLAILPYHMKQFENDIWKFLWRDKHHLVKKTVCIAPISAGGTQRPPYILPLDSYTSTAASTDVNYRK
jgi:hypothetical protein